MKHVRLRGLYDERRAGELADAMIPIIRGECDTIDMTAVEHIERVALTGFLPLIKEAAARHCGSENRRHRNE